jgi:LPS O-antigen subunit length determinant protein (WzzB/FepE family)
MSKTENYAGRKEAKDYSIGYQKPPEHTRFRKGQSGNSKGRTKKLKSFMTLLVSALEEQVQVKEGGKSKWISKREALAKQFANMGAAGDLRAVKLLAEFLQVIDQKRGLDANEDLYKGAEIARQRLTEKLDRMHERIMARVAKEEHDKKAAT